MKAINFEARRKKLKECLHNRKLDGVVLSSQQAIRYITGFRGSDSAFFLSGSTEELITDSRFSEQAQKECPDVRVLTRNRSLIETLALRFKKEGARWVGIESKRISLSTYRGLLGKARGIRFRAVDAILEEERERKEPAEVERIKKALSIAETSFKEVIQTLRPGTTEAEASNLLEFEMKRRGAEDAAFPTIVAFGSHSSQPHASAGSRRLKADDIALFDWGAVVDGYRCDLTRVILTGRIRRESALIYEIVEEAVRRAIEAIEPGIPLGAVDLAARKYIKEYGYGRNFAHGIGHGVGLDVHEPPYLNRGAKGTVKAGMVFTIEPAVYLPGKFGVRLEQMIHVTERQAVILPRLPIDMWAYAVNPGCRSEKGKPGGQNGP